MIRLGPLLQRLIAALAVCAALAAPARAQDWTGQVTLYGWGAGVTGDFRPFAGGPDLSFSRSLSEVLDDLDRAFFATGLARRGNLVLFGDLTYSAVSREGLVPPGVPAAGEVTIRSLTLAAGRRFQTGGGTTVDALAGLRGWSVEGAVAVPAAGVSLSPTSTFVDPILALRVNTPLSDRWSLLGYADVGGFGVGSEFTWQLGLTANYRASERLYLSAGWRHLHLRYEEDGKRFDGDMRGPVIGATLTF